MIRFCVHGWDIHITPVVRFIEMNTNTAKPSDQEWTTEQKFTSYTREQAGWSEDSKPKPTNHVPNLSLPKIAEPKRQKYEASESVIADLEKKGYEQAVKAAPIIVDTNAKMETVQDAGQILMNFMQDGAKEFEERTGRKMSYAEMRAAWG